MIENIKKLFQGTEDQPGVLDKTEFIIELSKHVPAKPNTIRQHWLSDYGLWSIPDRHQELVLKMLQKTINKQNTQK